MTIDAKKFVGNSFPLDEGIRLADNLLEVPSWEGVEIDICEIPSSLLIGTFFHGFLQHVFEKRPDRLEEAHKIHWTVRYEHQAKLVDDIFANFKR